MKKLQNKRHRNQHGFTIIEVLIAALITSILTTATFAFYVRMHNQSENQFEISEAQNLARASLYDINKVLRMAGYKIPATHAPYTISGDSLIVYKQGSQPVDTIYFFLEEFTDAEYATAPDLPSNQKLYKLMKQENSDASQVVADYITGVRFTQLSPSSVNVALQVQTAIPDHSKEYATSQDGEVDFSTGFTTVTLDEQVKIRNVIS
ncbi:MAG: prepilin-type N-terminal cleavage/methylation domain-containing protein [Calditrichaeota bacterium]|nr:MAG: prepilin-type N-terminal cleavage/methylation domain-containing protein [Calditrichota bacterium]